MVELDEPVGKNNGVIAGHFYFKVPDNCGVLCVPRKCSAFEYGVEPGLLPNGEEDENA